MLGDLEEGLRLEQRRAVRDVPVDHRRGDVARPAFAVTSSAAPLKSTRSTVARPLGIVVTRRLADQVAGAGGVQRRLVDHARGGSKRVGVGVLERLDQRSRRRR